MRVVFMGTPDIAVPPLQKLLGKSYEVCGVFTQPDRPVGRGQRPRPGPVKIFAGERGIPVFQPEKIRDEENRKILNNLRPDFIVVSAYGQILPAWILETARLVPLNIHFSLLPLYRGAAPVAHAILDGNKVTGISIMVMQESLDSGPILSQRNLPISPEETTGDIEAKLAEIGSNLLIETMETYTNGSITPVVQDESLATWAPRISKRDAEIDWTENAFQVHNRIRAMNPRPGAYSMSRDGERILIWSSIVAPGTVDSECAPGTYLDLYKDGMRIQCGEATVLLIQELQKPSKRRINGREFASGLRLHSGDELFQAGTG